MTNIRGLFVRVPLILLFVLLSLAPSAPPDQKSLQLWCFYHNELDSDDALKSGKVLIDRALESGYTGIVLWCGSIDLLGDAWTPFETEDRIRDLLKYAASKHLKVVVEAGPFSNSVNALRTNPNWAESQRIVGAQFQVDSSRTHLELVNSFPGLVNPGFESEDEWFQLHDSNTSLDPHTSHGGRSAAAIENARGNARFRQRIMLKPWRQYHIRVFFKSQNFGGFSQLEILSASDSTKIPFNAAIRANGSHDWTELNYAFDSQDTTDAYLYFGVWGGNSGTIWFDDVQLEETSLIYVTRRPGTPLTVYDPKNPNLVYREKSDFNQVMDPRMAETHPFTDSYHQPPTITLPRNTHLSAHQIVAIDYYSAFPIPQTDSVSMCLTDPGVAEWLKRNAHGIKKVLPPGAGVLVGYDEIRQMNSCGSCRAKKMSAGELLAWNVGQTSTTFHSAIPGAQLFTWSDMFDPYHNAVDKYYYVEGTLAGSWKGLPPDMTIMNWNLDHLKESLNFFSGSDRRQGNRYQQIIAGYYDNGNGASDARDELAKAAAIPGINGLMYTTWDGNYSQLESYASGAKAAWPAYIASQGRSQSGLLNSPQWTVSSFLLAAIGLVIWKTSGRRAPS